jgi:hypothetical protein
LLKAGAFPIGSDSKLSKIGCDTFSIRKKISAVDDSTLGALPGKETWERMPKEIDNLNTRKLGIPILLREMAR